MRGKNIKGKERVKEKLKKERMTDNERKMKER